MALITLRAVRERLGISDPTLRRMEQAGRIKLIRLAPRIVRVEEAEVDRLIREASLGTTNEDQAEGAAPRVGAGPPQSGPATEHKAER